MLNDEQLMRFITALPQNKRKTLEEYDRRILEVQDKPPEYFFKKFKNGEPCVDAGLLQLQKYQLAAIFLGDNDNYRHVSVGLINALSKKYHEYIEAQVQLQEAREEIKKLKKLLKKS